MELLNVFLTIGDWIRNHLTEAGIGVAITFVSGFLFRKGWTKTIDSISRKLANICTQLSEWFASLAKFFGKVEESIDDDTGKVDKEEFKEAIDMVPEVVKETKDVIESFKKRNDSPPEVKKEVLGESIEVAPAENNKRRRYRHK